MSDSKHLEIKIKANGEENLYTSFSPEPDLNYHIKAFIKTKAAGLDYHSTLGLTIISEEPLDEQRFRQAMANWTKDEETLLMRSEKDSKRMLFGLLVFGSVMIILSIFFLEQNELLKYSLLPMIGSLSLSRAARLMIIELPTIKAQKWILKNMGETSTITFEYKNDEKDI